MSTVTQASLDLRLFLVGSFGREVISRAQRSSTLDSRRAARNKYPEKYSEEARRSPQLVSYTDSESQSSQAGQTHVPAATQGVVTETKCPDGDNGDDGHAAMGEANATQLWVVS